MKTALLMAALLVAAPSAAVAGDVYVKDRSPMFQVAPGTVYHYYVSPKELPAEARFTRDFITGMFEDAAKAVSRKDADAAVRFMLPDATVIIAEQPNEVEKTFSSPKEYAGYLKARWRVESSVRCSIEEAGVVIADDGQSAMFKAKFIKSAMIKGRRVITRSVLMADVKNTPEGPMIAKMVLRKMNGRDK